MRRTYGRERYLRLVDDMRSAIPDLALTTDIIVGFPGETDEDFSETLEVVEEVRYDGAFTFVYSPRAGTEAASMPDQIPDELKRERIERLVEVVQRIAHERNEERIGLVEQVLVEGPSRTDPSVLRGRTRRNTTVNFAGSASPGDLVDVRDRRRDVDDPEWLRARRSCSLNATLRWEGCCNIRDLGGLPLEDGGETRFGVIVRADDVSLCRRRRARSDYGVRRIVDLRHEGRDPRPTSARDRPRSVLQTPTPSNIARGGRASWTSRTSSEWRTLKLPVLP